MDTPKVKDMQSSVGTDPSASPVVVSFVLGTRIQARFFLIDG